MSSVRRLFAGLFGLLAILTGIAQPASADASPTPCPIPAYTYDSLVTSVADEGVSSERGPPVACDRSTTDVVSRCSRDTSVRLETGDTATPFSTVEAAVWLAAATTTTREQVRRADGATSMCARWRVAAKGGLSRIPLGFNSGEAFDSSIPAIRGASGVTDASIGVRGSAATGISHSRGVVGPDIGDIDFFIVSDDLFSRGLRPARELVVAR